MNDFAIEVTEDTHERGEFWLRVTHNGVAWSAIRLESYPEMLAVAEAMLRAVPELMRREINVIGLTRCSICKSEIEHIGVCGACDLDE